MGAVVYTIVSSVMGKDVSLNGAHNRTPFLISSAQSWPIVNKPLNGGMAALEGAGVHAYYHPGAR